MNKEKKKQLKFKCVQPYILGKKSHYSPRQDKDGDFEHI